MFIVVYTRVKDYVKYDGRSFEPVHIFPSGSEVTGKSYLLKVIYNVTSKTLLYHYKQPEKPTVFFTWSYRYISGTFCGTTIHHSF